MDRIFAIARVGTPVTIVGTLASAGSGSSVVGGGER
jgi:hypothetical protein